MTKNLIAQKGAATPAATHPGDAARFHARRTVVLPAINLHVTPARAEPPTDLGQEQPKRAARLIASPNAEKRKFTFRIDPTRHAAFCAAADARNVSRQRLLTEALDAFLAQRGRAPDVVSLKPGALADTGTESGAEAVLRNNVAALQLPL